MSDSDSSVSSAIQTPPIRIRQKYNRTEQNEPVAEQRKIAPDKPVEPVAITPPSAPEPVNYKKYIVIACMILMMLLVTYIFMNPSTIYRKKPEPEKVAEITPPPLPEPIKDSVWDKPHHHFDPLFTVQVE
ncbi:hypothetical protein EPVG_00117 [Emiliania huxleyi virus 201]|uniref:Uncharacterized protein n=1 Tax=viral metagenome TaxID=1070528 RepID=A0A6C0LW11_9ZZZZ|nr:hypothetical protein ELVG_00352 [Emiliania huxleyi virus 203]AEP15661.1 hypothetical protein EQVG_00252 [Emiliania huxleyi virus 207]AEP16106.1 hypothetical protein ERVG_00230 [Emiliania huxleyi virus 208]AET98005.1 hypothetical protein EPVG_00117 [Emiliania huxleyi virus 201]UKZ11134.1 hypothetical protein EhVM1_000119 [Emiliania huxleyi virus M1]CAZ69450.1 putative membrane protein [Emiliania huxleyi virus 99B1]|mmetsp:Transcript_22805/g.65039  ORF Transcript_22805/g.65039 Transcript_22805/m.65039 type:complete len:130 (+) Transcript_22805:42-431(+)